MTKNLVNVFIMLGGAMFFVWILALLDWLGGRKERRARASSRT